MTTLETTAWMLGIAVLATLALFVYRIVSQVWNLTLMRCPETGAVALVGVARAPQGPENTPRLTVQQCDLWPERKNCGRGCLARCRETSPGYRVNLHALRPFDRH